LDSIDQVLEEAVANAVYHKDYQIREPIKIRIFSHSVFITNSGGPDRSIKLTDLNEGLIMPKRYRNRRLGGFLKELKLTEGHATGLRMMRKLLLENGSALPIINTDEERTYFEIEIKIHPEFLKNGKIF
jgi:ATP-dependent DNA helicase RecG